MRALVLICCISMLQGMAMSTDLQVVKFSSNMTTCESLNNTKSNHVTVQETQLGQSQTQLIIHLDQENFNVSKAAVTVSASNSQFVVQVNVAADSENFNNIFNISSNDILTKNNDDANSLFYKMVLNSTDLQSNDTALLACMNLALVYNANDTIMDIMALELGCWTYTHTNSSKSLVMSDGHANMTVFAEYINSDFCSGAISNIQLTPVLAVALALIASLFNNGRQ